MATTLTRNLKLRINSNLTADAKYNLDRLDLLGSTFIVDSTNTLNIRSQTDILIEPESADVDGSGTGGTVDVGTSSHILTAINLYGTSVTVPVSLGLLDQGTSGTKYLRLKYNSTLNGAVDTSADRTLSVDLEGADRSLILGGNYSQLGGNLALTLTGATAVTMPLTGTLSTLAGAETLTNKSMSGAANTFTNLPYSSLILTGSIVNADVHASAAIAYSKLNLGTSIVNADISGSAAIAYSKLNLTGELLNADISASAAIVYSKLSIANSIVNADISSSAAIAYSKLALTGSIQAADIASSAGIPYSKLDLSTSIQSSDLVSGFIDSILPSQTGESGKFLTTDGTNSSWSTLAGSGTVTSVALSAPAEFSVAGSPITTNGTLAITKATQVANAVWAGPTTGADAQPAFRTLVAADIPTAVPATKLADGSVSDAEFQYLGGVTSGIQTQLNAKQATGNYITALTGHVTASGPGSAASTIATGVITNDMIDNGAAISFSKMITLTANRVPLVNASGEIDASTVTTTELGYLSGVTSAIQTQLGSKQASDATLTALAAYNTNGLLTQTAADTFAGRTITAGAGVSVTNGDGVSGNPTIAVSNPVTSSKTTWLAADGTSKAVTHSFNSTDVIVQVFDIATGETVVVDVVRTDVNTVTLTASEAPGVSWRVLILAI